MSPWWWACLLPLGAVAAWQVWLGARDADEGFRRMGLPRPWRALPGVASATGWLLVITLAAAFGGRPGIRWAFERAGGAK